MLSKITFFFQFTLY